MEKMNDLKDLLRHEIQDLYSVEEQIVAALPSMIDRAKNADLKRALQNHLKVTEQQRSRLEQVQKMLNEGEQMTEEKKGLFSRLFKSRQVCRGMQGIIEEGSKIMNEEMDQDVRDAAIIASAQKIEHYEICGYGTARTFARELNMERVAQLLEQTLDEEYEADEMLTQMAIRHINVQAGAGASGKRSSERMQGRSTGGRTTQERARMEEPEMEMVSNRGRASAAGKTTANGRGSSSTPRNTETSRTRGAEPSRSRSAESSRTTAASNRNTGSTSRIASGGKATTGRTTSSSNRTGTSRTGTTGRSETGSSRGAGRTSSGGRNETTSRGTSRGR